MSEASRHRPSIDLDELERQLREAARPRQAAPAGSSEPPRQPADDPLAELARIVGQDDPFRGAFHGQRGAAAQPVSQPPRHEPAVEWEPEPEAAAAPQEPETGARVVAFDDYVRYPAAQPVSQRETYSQTETEPVYEPEGLLPQHDDDFIEEETGRRFGFNGKLVGAVAAALVAVAGIGLAITLRGGSSTQLASGKQPPVIKADTGPTKVAPQNPGGVEVPDQNKQIYERGVQDAKAAKIVGGDEQPVDVAQTTRADAPAEMAGAQQTSTGLALPKPAAPQPAIPGLGPPRVVKTVPVRPDGSVVDASQAPGSRAMAMVPPPPPMAIPGMTTGALPQDPAGAASRLPAPSASTGLSTPPKPKTVPVETITATTAAAPALNTPVAKPPVAAQTPVAKPAAPAQAQAPAPAPTPARQQVASTQPLAPVDTAAAAAAAAAGGFAVQLAAPATEQEAKDTLSRLQKRFGNELGTYKLGVRKADVGDRTVFRVRVSNLTREDANVLCTKLQAAGGVCFIAKN